MKKILLSFSLIISLMLTTGCSSKITNSNVFKAGIYEAKTDGVISSYYSFYSDENGGTISTADGIGKDDFQNRWNLSILQNNKQILWYN